ncbi:MAG: chemotaxis protein CheW [Pseudobdellovibrionaceae bacterium]
MDDFDKELKLGFLEEASQSLSDVEQCFLALEDNPTDAENLNKIFRLAHNLKGSSKAVGFDEMGAFTHEFETFILKIKNGLLPASPAVVNLLLRSNDHLMKMVEGLKENLEAKFDSKDLITEMTSPISDSAVAPAEETQAAPTPEPEMAIEVEETPQTLEAGPSEPEVLELEPNHELLALLQGDLPTPATEPTPVVTEMPKPAPTAKSAESKMTAKSNAPEESIRVAVSKVEELLNYVGEMVILQSVIREQVMLTDSMLLKKTVHQLGKIGKEIQDLSMSLRMVPIKPTFQKMQRIVRDTALALNKEISLDLVGEETEVDKTVLEKISDPLVHLVRNSVDHGIENEEVRVSSGKAKKGKVALIAAHQAGKLIIEVKDDGGGLDPEKLKKKAIERGILRPDTNLTDVEAYNLIFAPGFSTKEQVTDVSGRGVGMDVVKTNILELSGEIQIESAVGKGSTFRIALPLTLAIIDGMILNYGESRFVIPLGHVHETLRPTLDQIQNTTALGDILKLRGENIPLYKVGDFFGIKPGVSFGEMIAIVVRSGPKPFAILVDDIVGQHQVVVKELGPELQGYKGLSGSTILGSGKPAFILEPTDLVKRKLSILQYSSEKQMAGGKAA